MAQLTNEGAAVILNQFRGSNPNYFDVIPVATANNILDVTRTIAKYDSVLNDFTGMINRIGQTFVDSPSFENPLARFKRASLEYGSTIQEVFVGMTKARAYNPNKSAERLFAKEKPNLSVAYHEVNREDQYYATISDAEMKMAFVTEGGFQSIVTRILDTLNTASEADEYVLMKSLLESAYADGEVYFVEVGEDFATNPKLFVEKARTYAGKIPFPTSNRYNAAGVKNSSRLSNMNLFLAAETNAKIDVNVLSAAYNLDNSNFLGRIQIVDELAEDNVLGMFVDDSFFVVADTVRKMKTQEDASAMSMNYFLNVWQVLSRSPFATAIAFVKKLPDWATARIVTSHVASIVDEDTQDVISVSLEGYDSIDKLTDSEFTLSAKVNLEDVTADVDDEAGTVTIKVNTEGKPRKQRPNIVTITATTTGGKVFTKEIVAQVSKYYAIG